MVRICQNIPRSSEAFESPPRGVTCGSTPGGLQAKTALISATLETRAFRVCFVRVHHQLLWHALTCSDLSLISFWYSCAKKHRTPCSGEDGSLYVHVRTKQHETILDMLTEQLSKFFKWTKSNKPSSQGLVPQHLQVAVPAVPRSGWWVCGEDNWKFTAPVASWRSMEQVASRHVEIIMLTSYVLP